MCSAFCCFLVLLLCSVDDVLFCWFGGLVFGCVCRCVGLLFCCFDVLLVCCLVALFV